MTMAEKYLGKELVCDLFAAAMVSGTMSEKDASDMLCRMEKDAGILGGLQKTVSSVWPTLGLAAALGASTGVIGMAAGDALQERLSSEDPETKHQNELETMYSHKRQEKKDAMWMAKVRAMREELVRGYKHMSTKEYTAKYNALLRALDEKV